MYKINRRVKDALSYANIIKLTPSSFTEYAVQMPVNGKLNNFSFKGREYLLPIYNSNAPKLLLKFARQSEKTVLKSSTCVLLNGNIKTIEDINLYDKLATLLSDKSHIGISEVIWKSELYTKPCLRIKTRQGHTIEVATTHPMRMWDLWIDASELKVKDRIAVVRKAGIFTNKIQIEENELKFIAVMIGDGSCGHKNQLGFTQHKDAILSTEIEEILNNLSCKFSTSMGNTNTKQWRIHTHPASEILDKYGLIGHKSRTKRVPAQIYDLSKEQTALFLNRLWATDGSVKQKSRSIINIVYCSMSKELVQDVQRLLWKFGIPSRIRENWPNIYKKRGERKFAYILRVETQEGVNKFLTEIGTYGKSEDIKNLTVKSNNNRDTYPIEINLDIKHIINSKKGAKSLDSAGLRRTLEYPLTRDKLQRYVDFFRSDKSYNQDLVDKLEAHVTTDIFWDEIVSIEDIGEQECYDIEVKDTNNFIANGFITHNSTTLANISLAYSILRPFFRSLYVSPSKQQTETFSRDKIKSAIILSKVLDAFLIKPDNVLLKEFSNHSNITLRYAFLHADRTRGIPADKVLIDELQDILVDVIPIIEETMSHSEDKRMVYSGTPKSLDNTINYYWERYSTQNEWLVPCDSCGGGAYRHWNNCSLEHIGKESLICSRCGKQIFPSHPDAQWVSFNPKPKDVKIPFEGYRIPQIVTEWVDWTSIIDKMERYSRRQFFNEVLGLAYDVGDKPLVKETLRDACIKEMKLSDHKKYMKAATNICMGIDWGGGGSEGTSYTVITVGGYISNKFVIFFAQRLIGEDAEPERTLQIVKAYISTFRPVLVGVDFGGGYDKNEDLIRAFGIERIQRFQYANLSSKITYDGKLGRWMVNRSAILADIINALNRKDTFQFFNWEEFESPFATDMCSVFTEYNESRHMTVFSKTPGATDDTLHSIIYCFLASMIKFPRPDIIISTGKERK